MEKQSGERGFGELAGGSGRKRQRGSHRADQERAEFDWIRGIDLRGIEQHTVRKREELFRGFCEGGSGERERGSSGGGQVDAGGFPGVDHGPAGQDGVSDRELYLAADTGEIFRRVETRCDQGVREMDADGWPELHRAIVLREVAEGSRRERGEGAGQGAVAKALKENNG